jgi:hypothetical protein
MSDYKAKSKEITVVDGVSVDIEVSGPNEDRAEKVMMDLKDRLGWIGQAYAEQSPPSELSDRAPEYAPLMTVDWEQVFDSDA